MKKINLISTLIAVVMLVGLTNCKKDLKDSTPLSKQYVEAVAASFNVVPAVEITTKTLTPTIALVTQTMYMFTSNANFYASSLTPIIPNASYTLVRGLEFLNGSAGQVFWNDVNHNPALFAANLQVISNLTPAENVRVVVEGTDTESRIAYIGANDFNPTYASFPLEITQYRLGDYLSITTDGMASLGITSVGVTFSKQAIDLEATRTQAFLGANLGFSDIKLVNTITSVPPWNVPPTGTTVMYNDVLDKIVGNIVITLYVDNTVVATLDAIPATTAFGHGMHIVLSTTKVGSFDSAIMHLTPADIDVTIITAPVN